MISYLVVSTTYHSQGDGVSEAVEARFHAKGIFDAMDRV